MIYYTFKKSVQKILLFTLTVYIEYFSSYLPPSCRFYPSCSQYAYEAISTHGSIWGMCLALLRVLKCHPWHPGGSDPVLEKKTTTSLCCKYDTRPESHSHT